MQRPRALDVWPAACYLVRVLLLVRSRRTHMLDQYFVKQHSNAPERGTRRADRAPCRSGRHHRKRVPSHDERSARPRPPLPLFLVETISPYPPSSATRNQHAVVHHVDAQCARPGYWTYTVRTGVEPFRAVHARPVGLAPPQGCARLSCFRLPTRLSQVDQSSNQLPEYAYPTGAVPSQDRPPCAELPRRLPC